MTRMKVGLYIATQFTEQTDVMAARAEMLEIERRRMYTALEPHQVRRG